MGCLPTSGGCEREHTDRFVDHLNGTESRGFRHALCLDRACRNTPQPEALYIEPDSGDRLVIERKAVAWPVDYIIGHRKDHLVADLLGDRLGTITEDAPYAIVLEPVLRGRDDELREFAEHIACVATREFARVRSGHPID